VGHGGPAGAAWRPYRVAMDPLRLASWRALLARVDPATAANDAAWQDGAPTWMFHAFRPKGAGVEVFFPEGPAGRDHLARMKTLLPGAVGAGEVEGDDPGIAWLRPDDIVLGDSREPGPGDAETLLFTLAAWHCAAPAAPDANDLREPLYGLACSYELAAWVLAPLLEPRCDPFAPWCWLWRHGLALRFERAGERTRVVVVAV
jgi:hypothetical protein